MKMPELKFEWLPQYAADPSTAGMRKGFAWFNTTTGQAKMWDGTDKRITEPKTTASLIAPEET